MTNNPTRDELLPHEWANHLGLMACSKCGFVKNETSDMRPCKGRVKVSLRNGFKSKALEQASKDAEKRITALRGSSKITTTPSQDGCREAFEQWHDALFDVSARCAAKSEFGYPRDGSIQMRWQAWQAAWSVRQPATSTEQVYDSSKLYQLTQQEFDFLEGAIWQVLDDMDCFIYPDNMDMQFREPDDRSKSCCSAARDQLLDAYRALLADQGGM